MKFCPQCGAKLVEKLVDKRKRLVCEACGFIFYINPKVAAGVLVEDNGQVVLVRRGVAPRVGYWGLPSGFAEYDETIEETAIRECMEETGLEVELNELLGVYSFTSGVHGRGVLILYSAHIMGGELKAGDDASEVSFFAPDELPREIAFWSHYQALRDWKKARAITCRAATSDEAEAVTKISEEYDFERGCDYKGYVTAEDSVLFAAMDGEKVVGFSSVTLDCQRKTASLNQIFVLPSYRRWGIATRLIERSTAFARDNGMRALLAEAAASNPGLILYLKTGFRICGFDNVRYPPDGPDRGTAIFLAYDL